MTQYSVADARKNLPAIIDEAARGNDVQLTRRGQAVAVLLSISEYERLTAGRKTFAEAYAAFREKFPEGVEYGDDEGPELTPEWWDSLRDRSPGREVVL